MPETTLRDLFAAHALGGMFAAGVTCCDLGAPEVAALAYQYADAMLRARQQACPCTMKGELA